MPNKGKSICSLFVLLSHNISYVTIMRYLAVDRAFAADTENRVMLNRTLFLVQSVPLVAGPLFSDRRLPSRPTLLIDHTTLEIPMAGS